MSRVRGDIGLGVEGDGEAVPHAACGVRRWAWGRAEAAEDGEEGSRPLGSDARLAAPCLFTCSSPREGGFLQGSAAGFGMLSAPGKRL